MTKLQTTCPACAGAGTSLDYWLYGIPVNSVRLHHDATAARAAVGGDLALYGCHGCGFVWNAGFDNALVDYGAGYESTQSYSGTYRAFLIKQATALVEQYGLKGRTVVEIGCGQGEFLAALCDAGIGHGIGYDPAALAERQPVVERGRLTMHAEMFTGQTDLPPADLIICRNTLEHIPDVFGFVANIRHALGHDNQTPVFCQLPSWERVADMGAFWDIYYEHCSYFTPASLSLLFERAGFRIDACTTIFNGQYLDIRVRPGAMRTASVAANRAINIAVVLDQGQHWQRHFDRCREQGVRTVIWGGGSKAVALLTSLDIADVIPAVVDINPHKQGTYLPVTGHPVIAPDALADLAFDAVLLMNGIYRDEVSAQLRRLGLVPTLHVLD